VLLGFLVLRLAPLSFSCPYLTSHHHPTHYHHHLVSDFQPPPPHLIKHNSALLYTPYFFFLYYSLYIYIYIYIFFFFFFFLSSWQKPIGEPVIPHWYLETSAGRIYRYCNILPICLLNIHIDMPYLILIYRFYELSNAYRNYWVHILHMCRYKFHLSVVSCLEWKHCCMSLLHVHSYASLIPIQCLRKLVTWNDCELRALRGWYSWTV